MVPLTSGAVSPRDSGCHSNLPSRDGQPCLARSFLDEGGTQRGGSRTGNTVGAMLGDSVEPALAEDAALVVLADESLDGSVGAFAEARVIGDVADALPPDDDGGGVGPGAPGQVPLEDGGRAEYLEVPTPVVAALADAEI